MVDEYQDTNELQLQILKLLTSEHNNLCVVGDDDQSIYGFRGANIRNIVEFDKTFKDTKVIKLEINYRSTNQILTVANTLIEHNRYRVGKNLISSKGDGDEVKLLCCIDETHESRSIAREIKELIKSGVSSNEIAVLYRTSSISRSLEDGFRKENIGHRLIAGVQFYERAEIKDIISYLRVILNPNDDFSLLHIINKPKRGIGKISLDKLQLLASKKNKSLYEYIKKSQAEELSQQFNKKIVSNLIQFIDNIDELKRVSIHNLYDLIRVFEDRINLKDSYSRLIDTDNKIENINEFYGYFKDTVSSALNMNLEEFLDDISLDSNQDKATDNGAVAMMTIHASKGLEFKYVYIIGLENNFFPFIKNNNIEEERRLAYVAITRAKTNLTLCYVNSRYYNGEREFTEKSRFLGESGVIKDTLLQINKTSIYKKGDIVKHHIFGMGRVQSVLGKVNKDYNLKINFGGEKRDILSRFVKPL
jgi:DNA helicase-2/ATP-dependent DNA helicase PcrA